jgi:uncharacterized protein (TIGR02678 family)
MNDGGPSTGGVSRPRRAWTPEANLEVGSVLRLLMVRPWLVAGRDADAIAKVRRNVDAVRDALGRLGWVLVVERDLVRLRKTPPVRRDANAALGPNPRTSQWFFLLVAAAESMGRRVGLGSLVTATRAAAAEAEVATTGDIVERRAIVAALKMLAERGVIQELDGDVEGYVQDDNPPVLLAVHHTRLLHVIANYSGEHDPVADPAGWLEAVEREPDAARRMRRRLVDDTVVHTCDLDDAEADWLRRRVRGDDGGPLAEAFGLHVERRSEGAAFVVPDRTYRHPWELGPLPFPASGTVAHAALLICNWVAAEGATVHDIGAGWRAVAAADVAGKLAELAGDQQVGSGGWSRDLAADPTGRLRDDVAALLTGLDLARMDGGRWLFSPAVARWPAPQPKTPRPKARPGADAQVFFDFGVSDDAGSA